MCVALIAGIALAQAAEKNAVTWEVTIDVFSGRPNPVYRLQASELSRVQAMLSRAKPSAETKEETKVFPPGRLGYRGVLIRQSGEGRGVQSSIRVRANDILQESSSGRTWLNANDVALEEYLLDLAVQKGKLEAAVRQHIRAVMEKSGAQPRR
jgi:hypothetical protein